MDEYKTSVTVNGEMSCQDRYERETGNKSYVLNSELRAMKPTSSYVYWLEDKIYEIEKR